MPSGYSSSVDHYRVPVDSVVAYTAGLFDGEGSVYWTAQRGNRRWHCSLSQSDRNGGEQLVRWLAGAWGIGTCFVQRREGQLLGDGDYRQWHWSIAQHRQVEHFARSVLSFVHVKRAALDELLVSIAGLESRGAWFSQGEDAVLREHAGTATDAAVGLLIGRSADSVRRRRRSLGLPSTRRDGTAVPV